MVFIEGEGGGFEKRTYFSLTSLKTLTSDVAVNKKKPNGIYKHINIC